MTNPLQSPRETMIEELGLQSLPRDAQDAAIESVGQTIFQAVTLAIISRLPENAQEEFKTLTESSDSKLIDAFLRKHIPDLDAFVEAEAKKEIAVFKEALSQQLTA